MVDRRVCAALVLLLLVAPALVGAQDEPSEGDVTVELDPGRADELTVYVPRDEADDPERALRERAAAAGVSVHDVRVSTERERTRVTFDGRVVDERETYWRVTLVTTLGEPRGLLAREIAPRELRTLSGTSDPDLTVRSYRGTTVLGSDVSDEGGLVVQRHRVAGASDLAYGVTVRQVVVLAGWLLVAFAVPALAYREYASRVARSNAPAPTQLYRLQHAQEQYALLWAAGSAVVGVALGSRALSSQLVAAVGPAAAVASRVDGTLWLLAVAPFAAALLGPPIALQPFRRQLRGVGQSASSTLYAGSRELLGYGALAWGLLALLAVLPAWVTANPVGGALLLGAVVLARVAFSPYLLRLVEDVRPADDRLRAEVERCWSGAGRDPPRVYLRDSGDAAKASTALFGVAPLQFLFVTERFVAELDQSDREALFVHQRDRAVGRDLDRYPVVAVACGLVGLGLLSLLGSLGWTDYVVVFVCYAVVAKQSYAARQRRDADRAAAAARGVDAVAAALDRLVAVNLSPADPDDADDVASIVEQYPPLAERVARLRDGAATEEEAAEAVETGDAGATMGDADDPPVADGESEATVD